MNLAVIFSQRKKQYGPIADAILKASNSMGFDVKFYGDDLRGYENIIIFDTKIKRIRQHIQCDREAKVGWWYNDLRSPNLFPSYRLNQITHIFLCNREYIEGYSNKFNKKVYYMPQCGHELDVSEGRNFDSDVVFIGNLTHIDYHYNRNEVLDLIKERVGLKHIKGERTTYDQGYIYKKTPISLSISLPMKGYTSNRLFNILASGGFALVRHYPGIEDLFINRRHIVWFKTPQQALKLTKEYLNDKEERKRISQEGYNIFKKKHKAEHRIRNMVDIMNGKTEDFYGFRKNGSSIS